MRFVTLALALLAVGSIVAAIGLAALGGWAMLVLGAVTFALGLLVAGGSECFASALRRGIRPGDGPGNGSRSAAIAAGLLPPVAVVGFVYGSLAAILGQQWSGPGWIQWLFAYGIAAGPWTVAAAMLRLDQPTLAGVHAYIGHLEGLLASALMLLLGAPTGVTIAAMALLAVPSAIVGSLAALTNTGQRA